MSGDGIVLECLRRAGHGKLGGWKVTQNPRTGELGHGESAKDALKDAGIFKERPVRVR